MALKFFLLLFFMILLFHFLSSISHAKISSPFEFIDDLKGCGKGNTTKGIHNLKNYLKRFGYLEDNQNDEDDNFDDALESAVKLYQQNYHINPTGVIDAETASKMRVPRCGVPDIVNGTNYMNHHNRHDSSSSSSKFHIVSHYSFLPNNPRWPDSKTLLTYAFLLTTQPNYKIAVARAFQKWDDATHFTFSQVSTSSPSDLRVGFYYGNHGDGPPFDGPYGVLAHSFAPTGGEAHFDASEYWSSDVLPVSNKIHLETVALHEIGHLLGLGHSALTDAIMYSGIGAGVAKNLIDDDLQGIKALYNV